MIMVSQVVKVQIEKLASCITCPLCNKLFRDATTISECLHTFCRKCIFQKITDEELDTCPVCNINLGCAPLEKLRTDHSLEDLKAKLFPSKKIKKAKEPIAMPSVAPLQCKRKERSISSLVVSTPEVSAKSVVRRKRLKSIARNNPGLRESLLVDQEPVKKLEYVQEGLSSPETLRKISQNKQQNSTQELSKQQKTNKDAKDIAGPCEGKADLWKPLTCLVKAANKSKPNKSDLQEIPAQMQPSSPAENEEVVKANLKEKSSKLKVNDDENNSSLSPSSSGRTRKLQGVRKKGAAVSKGLIIPAQRIVNASSNFDERYNPIWFSLVASEDQEGDATLPQISSFYLRVKDGSLPVSSIKKYLVQKLGLSSEAEVEISLHGQPVLPTLQLHNLVEWWLQMTPTSERIQATVGSSAKDFVMVLSYGRKALPP